MRRCVQIYGESAFGEEAKGAGTTPALNGITFSGATVTRGAAGTSRSDDNGGAVDQSPQLSLYKNLPPDVREAGHTLQDFEPSSYLLTGAFNKKLRNNKHNEAEMWRTLYGGVPRAHLRITEPGQEICAECFSTTVTPIVVQQTDKGRHPAEVEPTIVLLCDGPACGREYHLKCCMPPLKRIPSGEWFCRDCSPTGSTTALKAYLESVDQRRSRCGTEDVEVSTSVQDRRDEFVQSMLFDDAAEAGISTVDIPTSELDHFDTIDSAARLDVDTDGDGAPSWDGETRPTIGPDRLVGKPIQLHVSHDVESDLTHTGRIVDFRIIGSDGAVLPEDQKCRFEGSANSTMVEYLVRFAAGGDYRKTSYQHWMVLEEHNTAIGTALVYLDCNNAVGDIKASDSGSWQPALVWLHTARALLSFLAVSDTSRSKKRIGTLHGRTIDTESLQRLIRSSKKPQNSDTYAFAKPYGADATSYIIRNMKTQAVGFFSPRASSKYTNSVQDKFWGWAAMVECQEQESIRLWYDLKLRNIWAPQCTNSRDEYALGPFLATTATGEQTYENKKRGRQESDTTEFVDPARTPALCPLVSPGLDRLRILDLLDRRGIFPTKDGACTLDCRIVSMSSVAAED